MQRFERPVILHEIGCQVIEQFSMDWLWRAGAKIAWCRNETFAKMPLPNAVDDHASGEWIVGIGNRFGQLTTTASLSIRPS